MTEISKEKEGPNFPLWPLSSKGKSINREFEGEELVYKDLMGKIRFNEFFIFPEEVENTLRFAEQMDIEISMRPTMMNSDTYTHRYDVPAMHVTCRSSQKDFNDFSPKIKGITMGEDLEGRRIPSSKAKLR